MVKKDVKSRLLSQKAFCLSRLINHYSVTSMLSKSFVFGCFVVFNVADASCCVFFVKLLVCFMYGLKRRY